MPLVLRVISAHGGVTRQRVDAIEIPGTQGDILYFDGNLWVVLPAGNAGQVLQTGGTGANPSWVSPAGATVTVTTTTHTADLLARIILVDDDTAGAEVTVTLPPAAGNDALLFYIKKLGTTANVVVEGDGAETIDGELNQTLSAQYTAIQVVCDGSNWFIV